MRSEVTKEASGVSSWVGGDPAGPRDACGVERGGSGRESAGFTDRLCVPVGWEKPETAASICRGKADGAREGRGVMGMLT